ncbi:MAG: hypothetical protein QXO75_01480 [Nitrososphaerota archaeon]
MVAWVQTTLFENEANLVEEKTDRDYEPAVERCDVKCLNAVHEKCRCRCGGRNHGLIHKLRNASLDDSRLYFSLSHDPGIRRLFDGKRCLSCGEPLDYAEILAYEHEGGTYYEPFKMKLWIFAECVKCRFQNALNKFVRW